VKIFILDSPVSIAQIIVDTCNESKIWLFEGNLGAGKTTTIQHICQQLGYDGEVISPTYSIINEYKVNDKLTIFHMDLYRLTTIEEAYEIGIEEYLYNENAYCLIEWPQIIEEIIDIPYYLCRIEVLGDGRRQLELELVEKVY
jgi:tRNA threonylcarbamoyladenosine biosynthesis protein TsaE